MFFRFVTDIVVHEHEKLEKALGKIEFQHYQQIEALMAIIALFEFQKFPWLLGLEKSIYEIKGIKTYVERYNVKQQVDSLLKQLDRKRFIDKARWNFRKAVLQKEVVEERKEFIKKTVKKMTDKIDHDLAIFKSTTWAENRHSCVHLSSYLNADDPTQVIEALNAMTEKKKKRGPEEVVDLTPVMQITEDQKAALSAFFTDNFEDLKRLCIMNDTTSSLIEVEQRLTKVSDKLHSADYYHNINDLCSQKFLRDGMQFFLSPAFVAGVGTSVYGLVAAGIIAAVLAFLALSGTALAIATFLCTVVFIILAPKFIYSALKSIVDYCYDEYKTHLQSEMRDKITEYNGILNEVGLYKVKPSDKVVVNDEDREKIVANEANSLECY